MGKRPGETAEHYSHYVEYMRSARRLAGLFGIIRYSAPGLGPPVAAVEASRGAGSALDERC